MNKHHRVVLPSLCIAASVVFGGCIGAEPGDDAESMNEAEPGDDAESMNEAEPGDDAESMNEAEPGDGVESTEAESTGEAAAALLAAYKNCGKGRFCIFEHADGSGRYMAFTAGTNNLGSKKVAGGRMNDQTSALWNRTGQSWCVYEHKNRGGHKWLIGPGFKGTIHDRQSPDGFNWNDKISSVRPAIMPPLTAPRVPFC